MDGTCNLLLKMHMRKVYTCHESNVLEASRALTLKAGIGHNFFYSFLKIETAALLNLVYSPKNDFFLIFFFFRCILCMDASKKEHEMPYQKLTFN